MIGNDFTICHCHSVCCWFLSVLYFICSSFPFTFFPFDNFNFNKISNLQESCLNNKFYGICLNIINISLLPDLYFSNLFKSWKYHFLFHWTLPCVSYKNKNITTRVQLPKWRYLTFVQCCYSIYSITNSVLCRCFSSYFYFPSFSKCSCLRSFADLNHLWIHIINLHDSILLLYFIC